MMQLNLKEKEPQRSEQSEDCDLVIDEFLEQEDAAKEPSS